MATTVPTNLIYPRDAEYRTFTPTVTAVGGAGRVVPKCRCDLYRWKRSAA